MWVEGNKLRSFVSRLYLKQREGAWIVPAHVKERARTKIITSELPSSVAVWQNSSPSCSRKYAFHELAAFVLCAKCRCAACFYKCENINVSFPPTACLHHESDDNDDNTTFNLSKTARYYSTVTPDLEVRSLGMSVRSWHIYRMLHKDADCLKVEASVAFELNLCGATVRTATILKENFSHNKQLISQIGNLFY